MDRNGINRSASQIHQKPLQSLAVLAKMSFKKLTFPPQLLLVLHMCKVSTLINRLIQNANTIALAHPTSALNRSAC